VPFEIFKAFPPDDEEPVAQLHHSRDGRVDIPAEIHLANGELRITLFSRDAGPAWDYSVAEFSDAITRAIRAMES